jgi:hypothetical protein
MCNPQVTALALPFQSIVTTTLWQQLAHQLMSVMRVAVAISLL